MTASRTCFDSRRGFVGTLLLLWTVFCGCAVCEFWQGTRYTEIARGSIHQWTALGALSVSLVYTAWYSRAGGKLCRGLTLFNVAFLFAMSFVLIETMFTPGYAEKGSGGVVVVFCAALFLLTFIAQSLLLRLRRSPLIRNA
jgi:hypothetical protein